MFPARHPSAPGAGGWFPPTRWSVVLASQAAEGDAAARVALDALCRTYWRPVFTYVTAQGWSAADAEDLTQEYFSALLADETLRGARPEKGKLRTLLLVVLQRFLVNVRRREAAKKRGGGWERVEGDTAGSEALPLAGDGAAPDRAFDQQWALALLERVLERLRDEHARAGKADIFEALKPALTVEFGAGDLRAAAQSLQMTEGAVRVATHRLRRRCRDLLTEEIAQTVEDDAQVEAEIRALFEAFDSR